MSMNFDKFTDRARGFIQSAQGVASRANHQQLLPEHLLKVLIEDKGGTAARLLSAGGGDTVAICKVVLRNRRIFAFSTCDGVRHWRAPNPLIRGYR